MSLAPPQRRGTFEGTSGRLPHRKVKDWKRGDYLRAQDAVEKGTLGLSHENGVKLE